MFVWRCRHSRRLGLHLHVNMVYITLVPQPQRAARLPPAEIVSIVTEEAFDELDAPPERITGAEVKVDRLILGKEVTFLPWRRVHRDGRQPTWKASVFYVIIKRNSSKVGECLDTCRCRCPTQPI